MNNSCGGPGSLRGVPLHEVSLPDKANCFTNEQSKTEQSTTVPKVRQAKTLLNISRPKLTVPLDLNPNKKIGFVTVAYNKLATFSEANVGILQTKHFVKRHIHGNPIHCDCSMSWLAKKAATYHKDCFEKPSGFLYCLHKMRPLYESIRISGDDFTCSSPASLKDKPLRTVNLPACQNTPTNLFLPFTTETTTTAKITTLSATTKNKFTITSAPYATEQPMTMSMIRQVDFFVNITTPKFTISSANGSEHDQHITHPNAATDRAHASKKSAAIPTAALVASGKRK
ncbi:hypothetical protein Bbelb_328900 [Branchiostoma belcheri]|nr:hypothetical protein Bbelb_328900 [Branchiostoma belcheri]